ncbi:Gag-like protein [Elysia marginata]|uniref:Gag-like protein n=1 Tax=Elysia marginata TaxID=1093978 RepID=A0AAV4FZI4_9GAST|nr:Gag-like protein [Elysia marginata]
MGVLGGECKISKTKRGVMLELAKKSDEEKLTKMKELGGVKVSRDAYLNTSRGVINHKDLRGSEEEEFVECIRGIISARRIEIKRGGGEEDQDEYICLDLRLPQVKAGYLPVKAVRGGPARRVTAPVITQNKTENLPIAQNSATNKARPTNDKPKTKETRKPQTFARYGTNPEVDLESIDSIWSIPGNFSRTSLRAGGTSPPCPAPRRQFSPSQQPPPPFSASPKGSCPEGFSQWGYGH